MTFSLYMYIFFVFSFPFASPCPSYAARADAVGQARTICMIDVEADERSSIFFDLMFFRGCSF